MTIHSGYLGRLLEPSRLKRGVERAVERLSGVDFDSIAVSGSSGLIFGGALSVALGKPLLLVRKRDDNSHAYGVPVEGDRDAERYLFVDDQVSSGETARRVRRAVEHFLGPKAVFVGTYEYNEDRFYEEHEENAFRSSKRSRDFTYDKWGEGFFNPPSPAPVPTEETLAPSSPPIVVPDAPAGSWLYDYFRVIKDAPPLVGPPATDSNQGVWAIPSPSPSLKGAVYPNDLDLPSPSGPSVPELYNSAASRLGG